MATTQRQVRADQQGNPVVSFVRGERGSRPWADRVEAIGPGAADMVIRTMRGWAVTCSAELSRQLIERGAALSKKGSRMTRDLVAAPPPPSWAQVKPTSPLRLTACDRSAEDLLTCWRAAYPPDHPDYFPGSDGKAVRERLGPLLAGTMHGPLLASRTVVDARDDVVGCVLVNELEVEVPWGGPWLTALFRRPGPAFSGLGAVLLKHAVIEVARAGLPTLGLTVSATNPVQRLYRRHGFSVLDYFETVIIPPNLGEFAGQQPGRGV